jgi:acyl-CoA synthetase (AMP-forming)/AMP-acid ligase II
VLLASADGLLPSPAALVWSRRDCDLPVVIEDGGHTWTWRTLAVAAAEVSRRLPDVSGQPVAFSVPNGGGFVAVMTGIWLAGGVPAPVSPKLPAPERAKVLATISPAAVVVADGLALGGDVVVDVDALASAAHGAVPLLPRVDPGAPGIVLCTSGTTGSPKAVVHTQRGVWGLVDTVARKPVDPDHLPSPRADKPRRIEAKPMVHIGSIYGLLFDLWRGRSVVVTQRFDAVRYAELVREWGIETLNLVPSMVRMMLDADVGTLAPPARLATTGTAPLPEAWRVEFESRFGVPIQLTYGSTEAGGAIAFEPLEDVLSGNRRAGTAGKVVPQIEVQIRDDDGTPLPTGGNGRIWVRGETLRPTVVGADLVIDADGWIDTGDVGSLDVDDYVYITGRKRELIIRGGLKMVPAEIENALLEHPAVAEAVVAGAPDPRLGEVPVAWVRLVEDVSADELRDFVRGRVAAYKVPVAVHVVDEYPRTETGKVRKQELLDRLVG